MIIKGITDEDFVNYKVPSMFIATAFCDFKCDRECGRPICQNSVLATQPNIEISSKAIIERYLGNAITKAIVFGGLEPLEQPCELCAFIRCLRNAGCDDNVVIYTGYTKKEAMDIIDTLNMPKHNIIVKFGRYIPDQQPHFDPVLGVYLASDNQYAERIS